MTLNAIRTPIRFGAIALLSAGAAALLSAGAASADTLTPVAPYVGANVAGVGLLGINNAGWTTGSVYYNDGTAAGFLRSPTGDYTIFNDPNNSSATYTQGRAIDNNNTVIGFSAGTNLSPASQLEFKRTADGTITQLTRPSDGLPLSGIAQGINSSGVIVGNYRAVQPDANNSVRNRGFILDGTTFTSLNAGGTYYNVNARGINDAGTVVGFTFSLGQGFIYQNGAYTFYTNPHDTQNSTIFEAINNTGTILGGYSDADGNSHAFSFNVATGAFTDINVPGATNVQTFGINDSGQFVVATDGGSYIYTPGGATAPDGSAVFMPVVGGTTQPGQSQFAIAVAPGTTYYVDPAYATGFEFLSGSGPLFAGVTAPTGFGVNNQLSLYLWNGTSYVFDTRLTGGVDFTFASPVDRFELRGFPLSAQIDPNSHSGVVTGLRFASAGQFDGFQNALTAVPEPMSWTLLIAGFGIVGAAQRRQRRVTAQTVAG